MFIPGILRFKTAMHFISFHVTKFAKICMVTIIFIFLFWLWNWGEFIYWVFNSDLIYYANHLLVNIYAFVQSDIVRAVLLNLILCERRGVWATAC